MPIMRLREIRKLSSDDRTKKLSELKTELSRLKTMISAGGAVENPTRIRQLRKTIAQIMTIENEDKPEPEKTKLRAKETAPNAQKKEKKKK